LKIIIVILLFISCQSKQINTTQKNNSIDSLTTLTHAHKRDTIDTKVFANKLLRGLAKVSDDTPTFACMDSLTSNNVETRDFYWQVFQVILKKSDGALSEVVGGYLLAYLQKYPDEFAKKYSKLNKELKSQCVHFAAYEYSFSDENDKKNQIKAPVCEQCNSKENGVLDTFFKEISVEVEEIRKDN
jgi:hypothetical protein